MILYNNTKIEFGKFPNGEVNLRKIKIDPDAINHVVTLKYESDADLFHLLLVRRELGDSLTGEIVLRITYVPYSRMDRDNGVYAFTLQTFARFINDMNWDRVIIYEPHSDVTPALLDRVEVVNVTSSPIMQAKLDVLFEGDYQVFFPDAGAQKRYEEDFKGKPHLVGFKKRDFETGRITEYDILGELKSRNIAIVDDLCSKGGTFALAAEQLRDAGARRIVLVVAHCEDTIFSGGLLLPESPIEKVITTDSLITHIDFSGLDIVPLAYFRWS